MFFSYTLAYDTLSIKFDFASIWRSMDEYIEYFFHKNAVTDHSHACCNTVNRQNKGKLVLKYNILQRQYMATSSSQALDNWSEIFYTCWYWSVKRTRAATPPSPCCAPTPPPPTLSDLCLTSSRREGVLCSLTAPASSVCYGRCTLDQLMTHRWCKHYRLLPSQAQVSAADCCQSLPPQNYCQNFIQSLLSHCTGRWKTLVKLQGKSSAWKLISVKTLVARTPSWI